MSSSGARELNISSVPVHPYISDMLGKNYVKEKKLTKTSFLVDTMVELQDNVES